MTPRGIRNKNPGNLERNGTPWQGLADTQDDPRFCVFASPFWGLRALMRVLLTYQRRHGLKTISALIARYAPAHENPTDAYAQAVARRLGLSVAEPVELEDPATLAALAQAIVLQENGRPPKPSMPDFWYPERDYAAAALAALQA